MSVPFDGGAELQAALAPFTSRISAAPYPDHPAPSELRGGRSRVEANGDMLPLLPDRGLRLLTEKVQHDFLEGTEKEESLRLDLVEELFFRGRIPYGSIIYQEARNNGLDPFIVAGVVKAESDFRPMLISAKNAHGLMQIVPSTGELMGAGDLMNPAENIRAGTRYLRYLAGRFGGDETMILAAYNAGEGTISRFGGVPPYRETRNYLTRVRQSSEEYARRMNRVARSWAMLRLDPD